jgi:peptidoglycan/xylan/chitin deacetylase (PgdA/CDA1 family)
LSDAGPFRVALTFDAEHPDRPRSPPGAEERILDALAEGGVRASFFLQGRWVESRPDVARRIGHDGHLIGHHSHYHARMPLLLAEGALEADVADGQEAIMKATGHDPGPWFRCPFGAGHDDRVVLERLAAIGYRNVHWDVEVEDWEPWRTGDAIARDAIAGARARGDGALVLLHTWPAGTAEAIGTMLVGLRGLGANFVTIDQLEDLP